MPLVIGFMNFVVPLQLGVRDVAFPTMNNVSFWLTASGALLINLSLFIGEFARTGWLGFPPLSEKEFSPGVGVDYYLVALQISGVGTVLTAVNFVTTILKIRAPGMSYMRMPVFCWTSLASNLLILAAFPVLTVTLALLMLDRYLGFHFFTNDGGGKSTSWSCRLSASIPRSRRPSRASRCSVTGRWCLRRWRSASSRSWSGCIISSPWAPAPTSMPSSASPA
jgi:cytochrome o ubiquinol oxidase subunit 1